MSNLKSIEEVVREIRSAAITSIGESLITRADAINSVFDDAYGSCLGEHYASGMECVAQGLRYLDELIEYADNVMHIASGSEWEFVRDALGGVNMEKAPLEESIRDAYKLRIKRYVSPTFGDHAKHYVIKERKGVTVESENSACFTVSEHTGNLIEGSLDTLGAHYYWDRVLRRWVLDALINPAVNPSLKKYMK